MNLPITLVSCYELGRSPLGAALPAAFLRRAGFPCRTIDLAVEPFDAARFEGTGFVAISVPMHTALRLGVRVAERVRLIVPDAHVCFFGLYARLNADVLLARWADSVIGAEPEPALVALARAVASGARAAIPGVRRRGEGEFAGGAEPARPAEFPTPARDSLPPPEKYARLQVGGELRLAGVAEASRGCKHLCRHCPIPPVYHGRFFVVPVETVVEDVRRQVEAGVRHVTFADPDFLNGPGHARRVLAALHREFPGLTYDFTAKVEHLLAHRELLPDFAARGVLFVVSAVESLSDTVLQHLAKGHTGADVRAAVDVVAGAGMALRPTWVAFTPWTTRADFREMLRFVGERDLVEHVDPVQFAIRLLVPPGSPLLAEPAMQAYLGATQEENFLVTWTHPDAEMDRLHREVARRVEEDAREGVDARATFAGICAAAGVDPGPVRAKQGRVPRLTESWFC